MTRQPKPKSPELDGRSCLRCEDFHEGTTSSDEHRWGECWRDQPPMRAIEGDDGSIEWVPVVQWHYLPYVCRSFKPVTS